MRFQFRLEKMLHFVQMKETMGKMEVAKILHGIQGIEAKKVLLSDEVLKLIEQTHRELSEGLSAISYQNAKIEFNVQESKRLDRLLVEEREKLEKKKREVARLSLRRTALENLREQRRKEFRVQLGRKQQKRLDESHSLLEQQNSEKKVF